MRQLLIALMWCRMAWRRRGAGGNFAGKKDYGKRKDDVVCDGEGG